MIASGIQEIAVIPIAADNRGIQVGCIAVVCGLVVGLTVSHHIGAVRRQCARQLDGPPTAAVGLPAQIPDGRAEINRRSRGIVQLDKTGVGIVCGIGHLGNEQSPAGRARREVRVRRHLHLIRRRSRHFRPVEREGIGADIRHGDRRNVHRGRGHRHADHLRRHAHAVAGCEREGASRVNIRLRRRVGQRATAGREAVAARRGGRLKRQHGCRAAGRANGKNRFRSHSSADGTGVGPKCGRARPNRYHLVQRQLILLRRIACKTRSIDIVLQHPRGSGHIGHLKGSDAIGERPHACRAIHRRDCMGGIHGAPIGYIAAVSLVKQCVPPIGGIGLDQPDNGRRRIRQDIRRGTDGSVHEITIGIIVGHRLQAVTAGHDIVAVGQIAPGSDFRKGPRPVVSAPRAWNRQRHQPRQRAPQRRVRPDFPAVHRLAPHA